MNDLFEFHRKFVHKLKSGRCPFVIENVPFVCSDDFIKNPYICARVPIVGFYGFTLIELMVTLAVVAILAMIAVPNLRPIIENNRMISLTNNLISDINTARSEALKTGTNVGICMSQSGTACDGASWQAGRMIFVDANNNSIFDAGETVVRAQSGLNNNTLNTTTLPNPLIFSSRGLPYNFGAGGNFLLCDDRGPTHGRSIQISPTGRVAADSNPPASCN